MGLTSVISCILRKETFYLTTHPKHFIYCYMASNTWSESSQTRLTWERNNHGMIHHQRSRFQRLPVVHAHNRSLFGVQDHRVWCWGSGIPPPPLSLTKELNALKQHSLVYFYYLGRYRFPHLTCFI